VQLVINYDMPQTVVNYIHRVGRTGRGGVSGNAITLYTNEDTLLLKSIGDLLKSSGCEVPDWILELRKPRKQELQNLAKRPVERENIDQSKKTNSHYVFKKQLKKLDKNYAVDLEEASKGNLKQGERNPHMLLAKQIREMTEGPVGEE
jgi:ATP-dependent RNA helicase DDX52/ROK1